MKSLEADICIVGTGPAGMTLCAELSKTDFKILVVESGGDQRNESTDALKEIESRGEISIKPTSRERAVGGTSTTWSGISAPLDKIDFEKWPIKFEEMLAYYKRVGQYGFPDIEDFELRDINFFGSNLNKKVFIANTKPWNFGKELKYVLNKPNVTVLKNSTVTELLHTKDIVTAAQISHSDGSKSKINAKIFVLAAGGLENSRLLLLSNIGNEYDQVGRYIMDHPKGTYGTIRLTKPINYQENLLGVKKGGRYKYTGLQLAQDIQQKLGLLNSYVRLEPETFSKSLLERIGFRKSPEPKVLRLRNFMDMEPRRDNRLILGNKLDKNGMPLPIVTLNTSALDRQSIIELHKSISLAVQENGIGVLESNLDQESVWPINTGASHHMGGTRMGADRETSVVDRNLKVHSTNNLYVCGSSVFPTGGSANPTYTICALSVRLADHLISLQPERKMKQRPLALPFFYLYLRKFYSPFSGSEQQEQPGQK